MDIMFCMQYILKYHTLCLKTIPFDQSEPPPSYQHYLKSFHGAMLPIPTLPRSNLHQFRLQLAFHPNGTIELIMHPHRYDGLSWFVSRIVALPEVQVNKITGNIVVSHR